MALIKNAKVSQVAAILCSEHGAFPFFRPKRVGMAAYISHIFAVLYELLFLIQE